MASYGTPSFEEFQESQGKGIYSFDMASTGVSPSRLLNNPMIDDIVKDAAKTSQYANSAVPTPRENENLIEKAMAGVKPSTQTISTPTPLAENLNNSLLKQYRNLKTAEEQEQIVHPPFLPGVIDPNRDSSFNLQDFGRHLAEKESSGGNYKQTNPNSSAAGKYQFLWGTWGKKIQNVTGITNKSDFLNNPKAQEKFFDWYTNNEVLPQAKKLQAEAAKKGFSLMDTAKLIHFRGAAGTRNLLKWDPEKYKSRDQKNNMGIYEYLGRHVKKGGR